MLQTLWVVCLLTSGCLISSSARIKNVDIHQYWSVGLKYSMIDPTIGYFKVTKLSEFFLSALLSVLRLPSEAHHHFLQLLADTRKKNVLQSLQSSILPQKKKSCISLYRLKKKGETFIFSNCRAQNILAQWKKTYIKAKKREFDLFFVIKTSFPLKQLLLVYGAALVRHLQRSLIC